MLGFPGADGEGGGLVLAAALILGRFVLNSREDLALLLNTVYPGRRMCLGGMFDIRNLFTEISSLFLPYKDVNYANNCEVSTYIHFAPFFLLLSPKLISYLKERDGGCASVGKTLTAVLLAEIIYMLVGVPQWLAEITMLRFCNRMHIVYQWTSTLYTAWGFSVLLRHPALLSKREKILCPLAYGVCYVLMVNDQLRQYVRIQLRGMEIGDLLIAAAILAFTLVLLLAAFRKKRLLGAALVLMMAFCGATVNPVERGSGAVTNHPISAAISEIAAQEPESRWLCTDNAFILSNFLLANGARVLDATNFYPDTGKWAVIDPEGRFEEETNRYANQCAELTEGDNEVVLLNPDCIRLRLNPETLRALDIRYLLSTVDYTEMLARHGVVCEYVYSQNGNGIFRLSYEQ